MSKDRLSILEGRQGPTIGWFLADEQEFGLMLGESNSDVPDKETQVAMETIRALPEADRPISMGSREWVWGNMSSAKRALAAAKLAIKNIKHPMPEWALKAVSEGWKPPKGWTPKEE